MPFKIFDGSSWNEFKNIKVNDGTSWQPYKKAFVHNGTEWKEVVPPKPVNTALPEISWSTGIANVVNQNVSVSNGSWTNSPTSYKYQWQSGYYAVSGSLIWGDIVGATSSSYSITSDEICMFMVGRLIRCSVIAINNAGESLPSYGSMFQTIIAPETMTSLSASVSENGVVQLSWNRSKGANGYYLQYQGPEVSFTQMDLGDVTSYTINTGLASGTLGIFVAPINTTSPWKAYSGSNVQGQGMNAAINDLQPLKPRVTATSVVQTPNAVTISWTNERLTQTSYEIRTIAIDGAPVSNGPLNYFYEMFNGSSTSYTTEDIPGGRSYTFKVVVNGTATGFTETSWESNSTTTELPIASRPSIIESPLITSTGRYFALSRGASWANNPELYSLSWFANGQPIGQHGGSITLDSSYDGQSIYVVSYATNAGGTSESQSNTLICASPSRPTSLSSPTIIELNGSMVVTNEGTWNGNPTSYRYEWKTINDRDFTLGVGTNISSYDFGSNRTNTYYVLVWASNQFGESLNPGTSNYMEPLAGNITYGACQSYSNGTDYGYDCSGTTKMTWTRTIFDYREPQLLNTVENGTYRYGCSARTYGEKEFSPTYAWTFNSIDCGHQQTNCTNCNSIVPPAGSTAYIKDDLSCPSGKRYYRTCITPSGCENIDTNESCVPAPTDCNTVVRYIPASGYDTSPSSSASGYPACASGYRYYKVAVKNDGCSNELIWGDCTTSTWYCTLNATDEQHQWTSATDVSASSCDSYAIACSTSGYPAFPAIPVCTPTPTPTPTPVTETSRTVGTCIADPYCPAGGERRDTVYYSDGTNSEQYVCCSYTPTPTPVACDYVDGSTYCLNVDAQGYGDAYQRGFPTSCPDMYLGRSFCGTPTPTPTPEPPFFPPFFPPSFEPAPGPAPCTYNGNIIIVPCGYNNCVYDNCGAFVGYTST